MAYCFKFIGYSTKCGALSATTCANSLGMGCVRSTLSYRVGAEAMKPEKGVEHDELESARVEIKNGNSRVAELAGLSLIRI